MSDISGLGSFGNVSYSFGSSDLKLPTTGTNFSAMPDFYANSSGGLSNLKPSDISFTNPSLDPGVGLGAGGGGGRFGTDFFARPDIASLFRVKLSPSTTTASSPITPLKVSPTVVPAAPATSAPIPTAVFSGTQFKPMTELYEPFRFSAQSSNSSAPKFSFTVIPGLKNLSNADWNNPGGMFAPSGLLTPGVPVAYAPATGELANLFVGAGFRPLQSSGANAVAQSVANQASAGQPVTYGNYSEGTDFRKWAEAGAKGAVPTGSKNCWEVFLGAAIAQGSLSRDKVAEAYKGGATGIQNLLTNNMQNVSQYDPLAANKPKVGDLVYFKLTDTSGKPFTDAQGRADQTPLLAHVAMVTGFDRNGQPVIASHFPKNAETVSTPVSAPLELTNIDALKSRFANIGTVEVFVGAPTWSR